ncbi:MAG: ATP-binding protein [Ignavibacteriaceae bacterium]|jgi:nitrogen-specific signal transduction histidine kinase
MQQENIISDKLQTDINLFEEIKQSVHFINFVQHPLIILNENGVILHANRAFLELLKADNVQTLIGKEFAKVIRYSDSNNGETALNSADNFQGKEFGRIFSSCLSLKQEVKEEYKIVIRGNEVLDFLLTALPLNIKMYNFIFLSLTDISEAKWKASLDRIFFHDILNSAGALKECLNLIGGDSIKENEELMLIAKKITDNLIDEIISHKQFLMTERNEFVPDISTFDCNDIMLDVCDKVRYSLLAENKNLQIIKSEHINISSDKTLLNRVIFNLVKNALEATKKNGIVELYCTAKGDSVEFTIRNVDVIPVNVQEQIFNKTFSTKGSGRGLGIYSAKLITENFLKGKLFFESTDSVGTVFYAIYPLSFY